MSTRANSTILSALRDGLPNSYNGVHVPIIRLAENLEMYSINMDPEYQRGHVWTKKQKQLFMGSLLLDDKRIPPVWVNNYPKDYKDCEMVDGKQRITAALGWLKNEFPAKHESHEFYFKDLNEVELRGLGNFRFEFVSLNPKEILKFYLSLNAGGTVHSEKELDRVRKMLHG